MDPVVVIRDERVALSFRRDFIEIELERTHWRRRRRRQQPVFFRPPTRVEERARERFTRRYIMYNILADRCFYADERNFCLKIVPKIDFRLLVNRGVYRIDTDIPQIQTNNMCPCEISWENWSRR